jgi:hypothetical protein
VVALLATAASLSATDRRTHTIALPPERTLSVELTIGHLRVIGEPRTDAVIDVERTAPTSAALARIPVLVHEAPDTVRVVGLQAEGGADPALKTDVTMRVPQGATLHDLRVMEGRITLSGLTRKVTADLRRGPIEATRLQGLVRLETGIGNVVANEMRLTPQGLIRLRAFNGDVRLSLAERPTHARVMALALNGSIRSDIPLTMKDAWGPRWGEASLGSGEPVISIDVVTGAIDIKTR